MVAFKGQAAIPAGPPKGSVPSNGLIRQLPYMLVWTESPGITQNSLVRQWYWSEVIWSWINISAMQWLEHAHFYDCITVWFSVTKRNFWTFDYGEQSSVAFSGAANSGCCNFSVAVRGKKNSLFIRPAKKRDATVTSQRTSDGAEVKPPDGKTCRINVRWESFFFFSLRVKRPYGKLLKRSKTGTRWKIKRLFLLFSPVDLSFPWALPRHPPPQHPPPPKLPTPTLLTEFSLIWLGAESPWRSCKKKKPIFEFLRLRLFNSNPLANDRSGGGSLGETDEMEGGRGDLCWEVFKLQVNFFLLIWENVECSKSDATSWVLITAQLTEEKGFFSFFLF